MPKKPRFIHPLRQVRTVLGLSQSLFAKLVGCAVPSIQRIENGSLRMGHPLARTIMEATGAHPSQLRRGTGQALDMHGKPYSKEYYEFFTTAFQWDEKKMAGRFHQACYWIKLLLIASNRAGQRKGSPVFSAIMHHLKQIAADFDLNANIDGFLREQGSVRKRIYRVRDLRKFPAYAKIIGFKDNKRFKPDKKIEFVIPVGWIYGFDSLQEDPIFPPDIAKRFKDTDYILDFDLPIPKEIAEALPQVLYWRIHSFSERFSD